MQSRRLLAAAAFALAAIFAAPAAAQNCANFGDVPASSPFCPNVEWVKNRSITLGCGDGSNYCPNDAVTRLQMAIFMNRLGTALTPAFVRKRDTTLGALNFSGQQNVCVTDPIAPANYPRSAIVRGMLNLFTPDANLDMSAWIVYTVTPAAPFTWTTPTTQDGLSYGALYAGQIPPDDVSLYPYNVIDLTPGVTYRFAIAGLRTNTIGGSVANAYCENFVQIVNRNGTSSPFDASLDPGPHGRGD